MLSASDQVFFSSESNWMREDKTKVVKWKAQSRYKRIYFYKNEFVNLQNKLITEFAMF